jgi:uncharacterized membrane protein
MNNFKKFVATTFLGGIVVILPLAIFAILAKWIISIIDDFLNPIVSLFPERWDDFLIKSIAFAVITLMCFGIGLLVRTQFGSSFFTWLEEQTFSKLPLYGTIKETVQQFFGKGKSAFSQVVLIEPFGKDSKLVGFVTDETEDGWITVFSPTAPNPTNGFVFVVRKENAEYLDVKTEIALKSIISLGAGTNKLLMHSKMHQKKEASSEE